MKFLQEVTEWAGNTPNHLYVTDDGKQSMIAYMPYGKEDFFIFKKPIKFETTRRKFKEVPNTFGFMMAEEKPTGNTRKVVGSKGEIYTVTESDGHVSCTCSGFKFRGKCKHTEN